MPHISSMSDTPPLASTPAPTYSVFTAPQPLAASVPYFKVPATPARPAAPVGYYSQVNQFAFMPNPNWITETEHMLQQQLLSGRQQIAARGLAKTNLYHSPLFVEEDVDINVRSASTTTARPAIQTTDNYDRRTRSAPTSHRSPSPERDYPRGTCTATRPSQAGPKQAQSTVTPAQDLEAFKLTWLQCCQTCLKHPLINLPPSSIPVLEARGIRHLRRKLLLRCGLKL